MVRESNPLLIKLKLIMPELSVIAFEIAVLVLEIKPLVTPIICIAVSSSQKGPVVRILASGGGITYT